MLTPWVGIDCNLRIKYKGIKNADKTAIMPIVIGKAFKQASLMQKIINIASLVGCTLAVALTGGAIGGYLWVTNPKTNEMLQEKAIEAVKGSLPIPGGLTGPAIPSKAPEGITEGFELPSF